MTVDAVGTLAWAERLAARHLTVLGNRWEHTRGVAARAAGVADAVPEHDRSLLVVAAWLHDLGYGPDVRRTGFHPLDGARFLGTLGAGPRLCALVAHHSGASYEAEQRGLSDALAAYPREDGPVLDALVYADMTTGPAGQAFDFAQRMDEISRRYRPDDPVHRAITAARPYLTGCVQRTRGRLEAQPGDDGLREHRRPADTGRAPQPPRAHRPEERP